MHHFRAIPQPRARPLCLLDHHRTAHGTRRCRWFCGPPTAVGGGVAGGHHSFVSSRVRWGRPIAEGLRSNAPRRAHNCRRQYSVHDARCDEGVLCIAFVTAVVRVRVARTTLGRSCLPAAPPCRTPLSRLPLSRLPLLRPSLSLSLSCLPLPLLLPLFLALPLDRAASLTAPLPCAAGCS